MPPAYTSPCTRALVDHAQHLGQLAGVGDVFIARVVGHAAHPVEIGAGAKRWALRAQHHGAHVGTAAYFSERCGDLGNDFVAEGVADFGLRQGDARDRAFVSDLQVAAHDGVAACSARRK
jgi:hypothetical protein